MSPDLTANFCFRFLSVELMLSQLEREPLWTNARVSQQCSDLPTGLSELYNSIFSSFDAHSLDVLRWLAYASRPISTSELAEAIGLRFSGETDTQDVAATIKNLLGSCMAVLEFSEAVTDRHDFDYHDHGTTFVRFFHESVRDFISGSDSSSPWITNASINIKEPHAAIASRCIEYLGGQDASLRLTSPFWGYAMRNWRYHLDMAQKSRDSSVAQQLDNLERLAESIPTNDTTTQARLQSPAGTLTFKSLQHDVHSGPSRLSLQTRPSNTLVRTGNSNAASQLVRYFTTPLQQACFKGSQKLVDRLLKHGANVNAQSGKFCSALHVAAYYGHVDIVTKLLEAGASVNLEGGCFGTALQAAIAADHEEVIDILLDHGADPNIIGNAGNGLEIDENGSGLGTPDYYDLPVRELRRVTTE